MNHERAIPCPCSSKQAYANCCAPFHQGELPVHALQLMRSRYSAYALCLPEYIIHTTHPKNPQFHHNTAQWAKEISEFCVNTEFRKLAILDTQEKDRSATVTFTAHLFQDEKDVSFTEKSYFEKVEGKWLYHSGQINRQEWC